MLVGLNSGSTVKPLPSAVLQAAVQVRPYLRGRAGGGAGWVNGGRRVGACERVRCRRSHQQQQPHQPTAESATHLLGFCRLQPERTTQHSLPEPHAPSAGVTHLALLQHIPPGQRMTMSAEQDCRHGWKGMGE